MSSTHGAFSCDGMQDSASGFVHRRALPDRGERIADAPLPGFELGAKPREHGRMPGIGREVVPLVRVGDEVEELVARGLGIADQLPAVAPDHALHVRERAEGRAVSPVLPAAEDGGHAPPLDPLGDLDAGQVADRRIEVAEVDLGAPALPLGEARPGDDQGHADGVLVHVLLAVQAVAADRQPLVAREDDDRVVRLAGLLQGGQDAADLRVHVRDHGIVQGQLLADRSGSARPGQELLVPAAEVAVVERMLGEEVRRQGDRVRVVSVPRPPAAGSAGRAGR